MKTTLSQFILLAFLAAFSATNFANDDKIFTDNTMVILNTNLGNITIDLNHEKAPNTVNNFLDYANSGFYDGTIFHRVIGSFMIQGGGFESGLKKKPTNTPIKNEANNGLENLTYSIAMARTGDPHSATAQFFINVKDNDFLNFSSETSQGWGYAVFGKVVEGFDTVDKIAASETARIGGFDDVPTQDIIIESVKVLSKKE